MELALINPPSPFLIDERVVYNLGLIRVATHLKADGHKVSLLDFAGDKYYLDNVSKIGKYSKYLYSSTSSQFPFTYKMFKILKSLYPNAQHIIGGSHASAISSIRDKGLKDKNIDTLNEFDTIFNGEGENTESIFKKGWVKGKLIKNIDDTLLPDTSFMDIKSYKYFVFDEPTTSIMTQRGCPYQCVFCCGRDIEMYNRVRTHSPKRILEELDILNDKYGFKSFMWYDDEINMNNSRLEKLCKELSTRPYQHRGFIRSDQIVKYPESVEWMKEAGFVKLCAGVESGSDRILELIKKKSTYNINLKARQIVGDNDIHYESFLLLGHPSETLDDIKLTKQWLLEAKPDDFDLNIMMPYAGSKIYDDAIPSIEFKGYNWEWNGLYFNKPDCSKEDTYYKGIGSQSASNIRTKELSNDNLTKLRDTIENEVRKS